MESPIKMDDLVGTTIFGNIHIPTGGKKMLALPSLPKKGVLSTRERPFCVHIWLPLGDIRSEFVAALRQGQDVVHHEGSIHIASSNSKSSKN